MNQDKLKKEIPAYTAIRLYPLIERFHFNPDWETLIEIADEIVLLICQAFRDGELDEILGVVGRRNWAWKILDKDTPGEWENMVGWMADMLDEGARTFIALRKEEEK